LQKYMERCRELLDHGEPTIGGKATAEETAAAGPFAEGTVLCPHCGSETMVLIGEARQPSWKTLFWRESAGCPVWLSDLQWADHRHFWEGEYGSDFCDEYLETQVEGAMEVEPEPPPLPLQLFLPGLTPVRDLVIGSF